MLDRGNGGIYPIGFGPGMIFSGLIRGGTVQHWKVQSGRICQGSSVGPGAFNDSRYAFLWGRVRGGAKSAVPELLLMDVLEKTLMLSPGKVA